MSPINVKRKLSKSVGSNMDLNKKVLRMKEAWDEVDRILKTAQTKGIKK